MSDLPLPISVHILTRNSGKTLRRTLESLPRVAEILVIDGGSTDDTLAIAQEFGARVVTQPPVSNGRMDFAAARNVGLTSNTQPWILALDSDETLSPELHDEITAIVASKQGPTACWVPRRYVLPDGEVIRWASTYPNERIYFFHRDVIVRWIKSVHERVELKPKTPIAHLRGATLAPLPTIEEYKEKNSRYIKIEAAMSTGRSWGHWLKHRVLHTLRSRCIAAVRLLWIWCVPHPGKRLPLRHEMLRFWYGWRLIVETAPWKAK